MIQDRREFLKFLGASSMTLSNLGAIGFLSSCASGQKIEGLQPSTTDRLDLIKGLQSKMMITWGDKINSRETFGFNNDFIAFHPLSNNEALLWVNHEYIHPLFIGGMARTKANIDKERKEVGGSIIKIKRTGKEWNFVPNDPLNRRIDGTTKIPFSNNQKIRGKSYGIGTLGNCAGGYTPWGTFLTCEENYDGFYGERQENGKVKQGRYAWGDLYPNPPEHYGWVVEIDPMSGKSKKLTGLGRCAHECSTVVSLSDGRAVAYTGDDKNFEHLYRFVSSSKNSLDKGTLYVASLEKGQWISMDINKNPILKKNFKNQLDVQIHARKAAKLLGATPLDRPEDIEIHPKTGEVFVTLTNNKKRDNFHGTILKISPEGGNHESNRFQSDTFLVGGRDTGVSCPDNIVFDPMGNLWVATDRSGKSIEKGPYEGFGNNGLFVIPTDGPKAGSIIQVASAPNDAELTGLCFDKDYQNLFVAVQHPGELTTDLKNPTSNWPDGGIPKSAVVALSGEFLDSFVKA